MPQIFVMIAILFLTSLTGCDKSTSQEPEGKAVSLTQEDIDSTNWAKESMKMWVSWNSKGIRLVKENRYEEALYIFNQAIAAWPKEVTDENPRIKHLPEPTDTYLQKANLYLKMNQPKLALKYFEKFESYFPGNKYAVQGKEQAKEMLKQTK